MATPMTAQQWFGRLLAVFGVLVAAGVGAGWYVLARTDATTRILVDDVALGRAAAGEQRSALLDQETGIRGYLLSRDRTFLAPYEAGLARQDQAARNLRRHLGRHLSLEDELSAVERTSAAWRDSYAGPVHEGAPAPDAAAGRARFEDIRAAVAALDRELLAFRDAQRHTLDRQAYWRAVVFGAVAALVVGACAALAFGLHRGIVGPLRRLGADTRAVLDRDTFDHRVSAGGTAELRQLGADVDAMRQRIVAELTTARAARDELERSATELRRSNAELEQFAYVASHDLQEPLRKITSFCQLLQRRYDDLLDDRGRQYIAFAVDGASRLQVLINDLLRFSRVGRMYSGRAPVDLAAALAAAQRHVQAMYDESGAQTTVRVPLPTVTGDVTLLTMLFQNLVHNAIKFAEPGVPPRIEIDCVRHDDEYEIAVSDNGIGVAPEFAEKVFVIFQRLHTREAYPGTGIGLAICKKVVEYHSGRIWVDPAHTGGTCIRFTLPAPGEDTSAGESAAGASLGAPATPTRIE
ncbi:histidine kinase [Pilimelia terevasa]|uniref:histidine kinase n=2 Tax=Pilimelia terevasa TaxID=53372 RepID=A0A8J3BKL3_9ACTN|nr:histidine kinase [Pilimelia terevasa]